MKMLVVHLWIQMNVMRLENEGETGWAKNLLQQKE